MKRIEYLKYGSEEEGRAEGARQERELRKRRKREALEQAIPWIGRRVYLMFDGVLPEMVVTDVSYRNGMVYYKVRPAKGRGQAELAEARIVFPGDEALDQ